MGEKIRQERFHFGLCRIRPRRNSGNPLIEHCRLPVSERNPPQPCRPLARLCSLRYTLQVDNQFIQVTAQRHITLQVGTSSLTLKPDTILIQADNIEVRGKHTFVKGDRVDINE